MQPGQSRQQALYGCFDAKDGNFMEVVLSTPHGAELLDAGFSVSGDVIRPGVYEVPNGITLRSLLKEHCGGVVGQLKAFAPSGPSGGFLPRLLPTSSLPRGWEKRAPAELVAQGTAPGGGQLDILDLQLDLQRFRDVGLAIGAGLVVYNDSRDMVVEALNCSQFFRDESCGKCVPCRIGSQKIVEVGEQMVAGAIAPPMLAPQRQLVDELTRAMEMLSFTSCGVRQPMYGSQCTAVGREQGVRGGRGGRGDAPSQPP
jgi:NADH:ubiquinone oxidoreductase subunit F (NADH-binding)